MRIAIIAAGGFGGAPSTAPAGKGHETVYGVRRPADDKVAGDSAG